MSDVHVGLNDARTARCSSHDTTMYNSPSAGRGGGFSLNDIPRRPIENRAHDCISTDDGGGGELPGAWEGHLPMYERSDR